MAFRHTLLNLCLLLSVAAMDVKNNCFECATTNGGNNFMC